MDDIHGGHHRRQLLYAGDRLVEIDEGRCGQGVKSEAGQRRASPEANGDITRVIRSCWHGGVEALRACTQIGAKRVKPSFAEIFSLLSTRSYFIMQSALSRIMHVVTI